MNRRSLRAMGPVILMLAALSLRAGGCRKTTTTTTGAPRPPGKTQAHWVTPLVTPPPKRITLPPGVPTPDLRRVTLVPTEAG